MSINAVSIGKPIRANLPFILRGWIAGILENKLDRGAYCTKIGGGVRVVVTDEPWSFHAHLGPGERLFVVPRRLAPIPLPYDWWPWVTGSAEVHVAVSIWPEKLRAWGTREAERYFNEHVVPLMEGRHNRPDWWWQRPSDWAV